MTQIRVTSRLDTFHSHDEETVYEGRSRWAAITLARHTIGKGKIATIYVQVAEKWQYAVTVFPDGTTGYTPAGINTFLSLLFAPPSEDEIVFEENTVQILISVLVASKIFGQIDYRDDNRHNELVLGFSDNDADTKTDTHSLVSTLVDLPKDESS